MMQMEVQQKTNSRLYLVEHHKYPDKTPEAMSLQQQDLTYHDLKDILSQEQD